MELVRETERRQRVGEETESWREGTKHPPEKYFMKRD